jgi:hypothetical protein
VVKQTSLADGLYKEAILSETAETTELAVLPGLDAEAELVRRARAREPNAWQSLYDQLYPFIYRYALVRLRRHEEAEDIASQCFLRAIQGIEHYSYQGKPFLAWLYRIAANLVADHLRRKRRENIQDIDDVDELTVSFGLDALISKVDLLSAGFGPYAVVPVPSIICVRLRTASYWNVTSAVPAG